MKKICTLVLLALWTVTTSAQQAVPKLNDSAAASGLATVLPATSSSQAIINAQAMVTRNPKSADGYATLGLALCHRAEEISDAGLYVQADEAFNKALALAPNDFEAEKGQVCVALGRHQFAHALDMATALNKRVPDDVMVYGMLVDANVALGNYGQAEKAAQWMLNLRPGNTPALIRAARLREVFGDQEGAIELLRIVLDVAAPGDVERHVNTLSQIAHLNLEIGNLDSAEAELKQALTMLPNDRNALNHKAQLCRIQGRPAEAVQLLRQSYKAAPELETLYRLAEAMDAAGMKDAAKGIFGEFERQAQAESSHDANANRELIFYYADRANQPARALQVAEEEASRRHDVYTLDAYAWALYKNARNAEAKMHMDGALKVGVRDASIFYHAGEIELQLGNVAQAEHYLHAGAEMNSIHSQEARVALMTLQSARDAAR
jgi:tetratricopeptide (TPR) repeat protein